MYFFKCNCYQPTDKEKTPQNVTNGKRQIENGKCGKKESTYKKSFNALNRWMTAKSFSCLWTLEQADNFLL